MKWKVVFEGYLSYDFGILGPRAWELQGEEEEGKSGGLCRDAILSVNGIHKAHPDYCLRTRANARSLTHTLKQTQIHNEQGKSEA